MKLLLIISGLFSCSSFFVNACESKRTGESVDYIELFPDNQFNSIVLDEVLITDKD